MSITKQATSIWAKWEHLIGKLLSPLFSSKRDHSPPSSSDSKSDHHNSTRENPFTLLWRSLTSHKLLLTGLIVLTIGAPIIYLSLKYQPTTQAAWYDDSFTYRQTVNITNSGSAQTDYQVNIGIGTSALINAGKMKSDCSDIRVTDNNGKVLPYWIETGDNGCNSSNNSTNVWTKAPSIPTSGATLYVYYGNPSATTAQNGDQVFLFFDDFSTNSLDTAKWNSTSGTPTFSGGVMTIPVSAYVASTTFNVAGQTNAAMEGRAKVGATNTRANFGVAPTANFGSVEMGGAWVHGFNHLWYSDNKVYEETGDGTHTETLWITYSTNWNRLSMKWLNATSVAFTSEGNTATKNTNVPGTGTAFYPHMNSFAGGTLEVDFVFFRKYASTEPSVAAPASEEKSQGPVAYWKFDEGYGTTANDSTANANNGSFGVGSSAPTWQTEDLCISGKCLRFDGSDDYLDITGNGSLTDNSTVEFWAKPLTGAPENWEITVQIGTGGAAQMYDIVQSNGTIYVDRWGGGYSASTGTINWNQWNHLAFVYTESGGQGTITYYINGKNAGSSTSSSLFHDVNIANVYIGNDLLSATGGAYKGFLDEVKIYPYARTAAQIKSDYAAGLAHAGAAKGISASMGSNSKNNSALSDGLVGYWKLDETSSPSQDSSGVGNTGTWNGNVAGIAGRFGVGASFDGNSATYINAGSSSLLNFTSNGTFAISAWIKPDTLTSAWRRGIIVQENYLNSGFRFGFANGGQPIFWTSQSGGTLSMTGSQALTVNQWNHLVITYNNQQAYIYLNGQQTGSGTGTYVFGNNSAHIGKAVNEAFSGAMDEVRYYNRALSPKEVSDLYNWAPGPAGYWNFDEGSGVVLDRSGNGNTGSWGGSGTVRFTGGKFGKAGQFNGTDDVVTVADNSAIEPANMTIEAWVYQTGGSGTHYSVARKENVYVLGINPNGSLEGAVSTAWSWHDSGVDITSNTWTHIAMTYDGTTMKFYKNGILAPSTFTDGSGNITGNSNALTIGQDPGNSSWFGGKIDDLRIYSYARTQKQIVEDMNGGHPAVGSPVGSAVAHYKFDEGYGATAHNSGNGGNTLNGTLGTGSSAPTWTNNGKYGKALNFDGGDYVTVGSESTFDFTDNFTLSAWIKPQGSDTYNGIIGKYTSTSGWDFILTTGQVRMAVRGTSSIDTSQQGSDLRDGNWHHVMAVVKDASSVLLYVDGKLIHTANGTWTATTNDINVVIGSRTATNLPFNGSIDEVKIYPYALTEDEVKLDYNRGAAMVLGTLSVNTGNTAPPTADSQEYCIPGDSTSCASPVGRWDFNEGIGSTANDTSGNGNVCTLNGSATWNIGKIGKALSMTGASDYATCGTTFNPTQPITFEGWVYLNSLATNNAIVAKDGTWLWYIRNSGGTQLSIYNTGSDVWASYTFATGQWYFVATTIDASNNVKHYVNGQLIPNTSGSTISLTSNANTFTLGKWSTTGRLNGKLDQVRVYNYARSPAQIAWDYNRGAPVGHWKFDEAQGTTAYDSTGNGNNGNINIGVGGSQTTAGTITSPTDGTGAWYNGRTGKLNYSLSFDGTDDYVTIAHNAVFVPPALTVSAWIKPTALSSYMQVISKFPSSNYSWQMNTTNTGKLRFDYSSNGTGYGVYTTSSTLTAGTWQFVTVTWDGSTVRGYINGVADAQTTAFAGPLFSANTTVDIGRTSGGNAQMFSGQIDDVRIYSYALTPTQVKLLFNNGAAYFGPQTGAP